MYKIVLVEDDSELRSLISRMLEKYEYRVSVIERFDDVVGQIMEAEANVVLLDIHLPGVDGFHICRAIRKQSHVPILMISARNTESDQILAMELGADDYMVKPFSVELLHSKIRACIRRTYGEYETNRSGVHLGDFVLDGDTFLVSYQARRVELTKNEFKIVKRLVQDRNVFVSRESLLNELWDDVAFVDPNTLNVHISRIKNKLNEIGIENVIHTKRGYGYKFVTYWLGDAE
ncbi:response regulator transcription factor [Paenibacillus sp. 1P07SE]|uniref:response regulator transcription factor n=1 Tax=Paenibacillus sp. 1P07SE TaxID=3132209 RepID=UPI0039A5BF01